MTVAVVMFAGSLLAGKAGAEDASQPFSRARFRQDLENASVPPATTGTEPAAASAVERGLERGLERGRALFTEQASPAALWTRVRTAIERRTLAQMQGRLEAVRADMADDRGRPDERLDTPSAVDDHLETLNRGIHDLNRMVSDGLLDPAADYYLTHTSRSVQDGVANVFANLREPITVGSSLLQGSLGDAGNGSMRFAINSTFGLLGVYDRAADLGFPPVVRTLDEVLCVYGLPSGPYVVMPFFGPSSVRDSAARVATMVAQYMVLGPLIVPYRLTDTAAQYIEVRDQMKFMDTLARDTYDGHRTLYSQMQILPCNAQTRFSRQLFAR
ncbi:MAG: VacJ family lipoprotein [Alphaproteobacteria bacterium]